MFRVLVFHINPAYLTLIGHACLCLGEIRFVRPMSLYGNICSKITNIHQIYDNEEQAYCTLIFFKKKRLL